MYLAKVAVEKTVYHFDQPFDYLIPDFLLPTAKPGCRVLVPFGTASAKRQGMILATEESKEEPSIKIKPLEAVLDSAPLLSNEGLLLISWIKEQYFCTLYEAARLLFPIGFQYHIKRFFSLTKGAPKESLSSYSQQEQEVIQFLQQIGKPAEEKELFAVLKETKNAESILKKLFSKGVLEYKTDSVQKISDATQRMIRLKDPENEKFPFRLTARQKEVIQVLQDAGAASVKGICYYTGVTPAVPDNLVKKGICEFFESPVYRNPYESADKEMEDHELILSAEQETAYQHLKSLYDSSKTESSLLYGITGSGKTSIFLKLIDHVQQDEKGIILMVPEISLTSQMIEIFHRRYGAQVAVFHSGLSMGERMDEWKRVRDGKASIVIGTRSAVFAPLPKIGLIILDEEQEDTYQSEQSPRYHARDIAHFRCAYHHALLLLASATPRIETYYAAQKKQIGFDVLSKRFGTAILPQVEICDMNREIEAGNTTILSSSLLEALKQAFLKGQQAILLLNRRGYNTFASCRACGHVMTCPHCSISLTYHRANGRLMCHYCGYSIPFTKECPSCHEEKVHFGGSGTQKAEEQLQNLLPEAKILRLDTDATMSKNAYEIKLNQFRRHEYDLIVGTQMVAKGLDFENVTVVGVLSADQALYCDDFRSYEHTFDLLTQVVGRAGRGNLRGKAFIQTYTPENPILDLAKRQDYPAFYQSEIAIRKAMLYPPFADICVIGFIGKNEQAVKKCSASFLERLQEIALSEYSELPLRVLSPSPASIPRVSDKYRYKLMIKCRNSKRFREMISRLLISFGKNHEFRGITVFAQINPCYVL
ncbi:MAG: primosomal protein N' [Oscillospiraceae bacterium]